MAVPSRAEGSPSDLFLLPSATDPILKDDIFAKEQLENTLPFPDSPLEVARRQYMLHVVSQLPKVREAWKAGRLTLDEKNHNIIEHHVVSTIIGGILAREAGLPEETGREIEHVLSVHDVNRLDESEKLERATTKKKGSARRRTVARALTNGNRRILEPLQVDEHIIQLTEANVPENAEHISSDPRKQIIHYIDAIMDGSFPRTPQERMQNAATTSGRRNSTITPLRDGYYEEKLAATKAYRDIQTELATREAEVLSAMIRTQGIHTDITADSLPAFLQQRFDEEVMAFARQNNLPL